MRRITTTAIATALTAAALTAAGAVAPASADDRQPTAAGRTQLVFQYYDKSNWGSVSAPRSGGARTTIYTDHPGRTAEESARTAPYWDVLATTGGWSRLLLNGQCLGIAARPVMLQPVSCTGTSAQEWRLVPTGIEQRSTGAVFGKSVLGTMPSDGSFHIGVGTAAGRLGGDHEGLQPAAVGLSSPALGAEVTDLRPTFTGTGNPGGSVTVRESDGVIGTGTVDDTGRWSITSGRDLAPRYHEGTVTQAANGVTSSTPFRFTLSSLAS